MAKHYKQRTHYKQRDLQKVSTPPTQADMAKYYDMLKGAKNDNKKTTEETNTDRMGKTTG